MGDYSWGGGVVPEVFVIVWREFFWLALWVGLADDIGGF
jgi:hypothetical protein